MSVWVEIARCVCTLDKFWVTLHVSVWVEMKLFTYGDSELTSRSTWACELKYTNSVFTLCVYRHAPRERVSWNILSVAVALAIPVTLHVSVWVEMTEEEPTEENPTGHAPRERVSWNSHRHRNLYRTLVTLHVSVWVEIVFIYSAVKLSVSRSTWACELKCMICNANPRVTSHAPRERVSWNCMW